MEEYVEVKVFLIKYLLIFSSNTLYLSRCMHECACVCVCVGVCVTKK